MKKKVSITTLVMENIPKPPPKRRGIYQKKTFEGITNELKKITQGIAVTSASENLAGLKAILSYTTKTINKMEKETFKKADFNRVCFNSTEIIKNRVIDNNGNKIEVQNIIINSKKGNIHVCPDSSPIGNENELTYTQRFRDRMDFIGKAVIDMILTACDDEMNTLEKDFKNLQDQEVKNG